MLLSQVLQGYWLDKETQFSARTVESYKARFADFVRFVGDKEFGDITTWDIRSYLAHCRERGLSERSVSDYWVPLSSLWTWAEHELGTEHIIRGKVRKPKFDKPVIEPFRLDEIKRLLQAADHQAGYVHHFSEEIVQNRRPTAKRDRAIILTLLDSGLRASELCALTIADYDEERGRIFVRKGKGNKRRILFLGKSARRAIWYYMAERGAAGTGDPLFPTRLNRHINRNNLRQLLGHIGKSAGVPNVHPHRFRHTFAIMFLRNGGNVFELQKALGHESMDTVKIYVNLARLDLEEAQRTASPADNWKL